MSLKAMAAAWLPDRLVPRRERTAVSQEQERAAHTAAATATASSSKSSEVFLVPVLYLIIFVNPLNNHLNSSLN